MNTFEEKLTADLALLSFDELSLYEQICMRKENFRYDPMHRIVVAKFCNKYKRNINGRLINPIHHFPSPRPWQKDISKTNVYEHTVLINMAREREYYKQQVEKYLIVSDNNTKEISEIKFLRKEIESYKELLDKQQIDYNKDVLNLQYQNREFQEEIQELKRKIQEKDRIIVGLL